jgi:hypothetical protein
LHLLFGSDWPVITPDRWMANFEKLDIRDEVQPKVLKAMHASCWASKARPCIKLRKAALLEPYKHDR